MRPEQIKRLQAIAREGLANTAGNFDHERYQQLLTMTDTMCENGSSSPVSNLMVPYVRTPFTGVRGAAFRDGQILLVKEASSQRWTLPGGYCDVGESPAESIEKEMFEESGFRVRAKKLIGIYDRDRHDHSPSTQYFYMFFFLCEIVGGTASTSLETSDVGFFTLDDLPSLDAGRITHHQLTRCFTHYHNPQLPTEFD